MYSFPILIQLKYFLGGVHHFITVVGKCIFDGNFPYALPLTKCELEYCFINNNEKKEIMVTKEYWKPLGFPNRE